MCIIYTLDSKYPPRPLSSARVVYTLNHCSVTLIPFTLSFEQPSQAYLMSQKQNCDVNMVPSCTHNRKKGERHMVSTIWRQKLIFEMVWRISHYHICKILSRFSYPRCIIKTLALSVLIFSKGAGYTNIMHVFAF